MKNHGTKYPRKSGRGTTTIAQAIARRESYTENFRRRWSEKIDHGLRKRTGL